MRRAVRALSVCLTVSAISGCTGTAPLPAPQPCVTPTVARPVMDNSRCGDILCRSRQCLHNYIAMRAYAERLEAAASVCR